MKEEFKANFNITSNCRNATSVVMILCRLNEDRVAKNRWNFLENNKNLQHSVTKLCLDREGENRTKDLVLSQCDDDSKTQHWMFTK
jgi:Ricin-type beta-trefoil lectin domain